MATLESPVPKPSGRPASQHGRRRRWAFRLLAVGLAVRLRELVWMLPGVIYMLGRSLKSPEAGTKETQT